MRKTIFVLVSVILFISIASALTINSIDYNPISPGEQTSVRMEIENNLNDDIEDISVKLNFANLPFTPIGNSEESLDELEEGDEEDFIFRIKAANNIPPGDYEIPYEINYFINDLQKTKTGSIGITIKGDSKLSFSISTNNPVIGSQDTITLKIVNKGFANAKFLSVTILPEGFTLLSEKEVYIGEVDSDDFETAEFDVIYTREKPNLVAIVEYTGFDNQPKSEAITIPITIYTKERATELGIIKKSNAPQFIAIATTLILAWILYRTIRKGLRKRRLNK